MSRCLRCLLWSCLAALVAAPAAASPAPARAIELRALELQPPLLWLAQSDEPTPPPGDSDEPAPPPGAGDEPTAPKKAADEPTPPAKGDADEPAKPGTPTGDPSQEPGYRPDEPAPIEKPKPKGPLAKHGLGLQLRAIFVHEWFLNAFLDASTPLNSMAFGAEFIRRKNDLDIIASVDFGFYGPEDGNYLGNGENPATKTDYVQFRDFNILSFNAHFIWHLPIQRWVSFIYGVGIGLGVVLGDMYRISNDPARCTRDNAANEDLCFPRGVDPRTREEDLKRLAGGVDDPNDPHLFKEDGVPPVVPMIHALVGFNFNITDEISVRVDGGFRNAFYIGATSHWFFF